MREDDGMTLTEFLLARIAEDEQAALYALTGDPVGDGTPGGWGGWWIGHYHHYHRHDPTRVLAECEAKRRIMTALGPAAALDAPTPTVAAGYRGLLGYLAAIYADHPDYRQEWKP